MILLLQNMNIAYSEGLIKELQMFFKLTSFEQPYRRQFYFEKKTIPCCNRTEKFKCW